LTRSEALLYHAAQWIDRLIDRLRDRPMETLGYAAAALALLASIAST
jgi:hypothetical protein